MSAPGTQNPLSPGTVLPSARRRASAAHLVTYSAVTWNPHRIHYDREYVRGLGPADLVVHGALIADWVTQWASGIGGASMRISRFSYRVVTPAFVDRELEISGEVPQDAGTADDTEISAWVRDDTGATVLVATIQLCARQA